jgi:CBS domain-containing protein
MRPDEPVSRIMTEAVVVIEADRPVSEVLDCFFQYPIHHLPVVRDGRLAGMLSSADVMKLECLLPKSATDRASYLDQRLTIEQLMRTPVVSLRANASLGDAAEQLIDSGVHAAPVVDDEDRILGIVTTTDIMRSVLRGPPRKGTMTSLRGNRPPPTDESRDEPAYRRKPTAEESATALSTALILHVEARDPRHLGKTTLYLQQRCDYLERVLELADRFLRAGQDEQTHALLLKAIHAAKRAEEHATGTARVPFPLE